ncbi:polysaccharide lyase 8 family protein [Helcococcus bovis]|uniref:polysaccharide lyase 8 family protein n=1 Tax=Helcococcus bovis TaxID=3153252 RepID=UPI0038BBB2BE
MNSKTLVKNRTIASLMAFIMLFTMIFNVGNISTAAEVSSQNDELIQNGDFSQTNDKFGNWTSKAPSNWNLWIPNSHKNVQGYKAEVNNESQLEVSSQSDFRAIAFQKFNVEKDKKYEIKFNFQTIDKKGYAQADINENNTKLVFEEFKLVNTQQKNVKYIYTAKNTGQVKLELEFGKGTGTMLVDNVSVKEVKDTTIKPETNTPSTPADQPANTETKTENNETKKDPVVATQENSKCGLIKNCDFEKTSNDNAQKDWTGIQANDWQVYIPNDLKEKDTYKSKKYTAKVTTDNKLELSSPEDFRMAVVQKGIIIDPSKFYEFGYKVATKDKDGSVRIRIIEYYKNDKNEEAKNMIYSKDHFGTNSENVFSKQYIPSKTATKIDFEIWYEPKTGTAIFDDVYLKEIDKPDLGKTLKEESEIKLPANKKYLVRDFNADYKITDESIAKYSNKVIIALKPGYTDITVTKNGSSKTIKLTITDPENNKFKDKLDLWEESVVANKKYNDSDKYMKALKEKLDKEVEDILSKKSDDTDYRTFWNDIDNYKVSSALTKSYRRLESLAKQINQPNSPYYQKPEAIKMVLEGMEWLYKTQYNDDTNVNGNWWDYEIGVPRAINNTLTLMWDYFPQELINKYTKPINLLVPDPTRFRVTTGNPFDALGGNLTDMGRAKIIAAFLREDEKSLNDTINALKKLYVQRENKEVVPCVPGSCEGFYKDGSYVDHTNVAYTGAYGNIVLDAISQLFPTIQDKTEKSDLNILYDIIDKSFSPIIFRGDLMDMLRGRSISRETGQSHVAAGEVVRGVLRIADATTDSSKKQELLSLVKSWVEKDDFFDIENALATYKDIALMNDLKANNSIDGTEKTSLDVFTNMNKIIFKNIEKDFAIGLSMHSDTIKNYEYMNNENAKGWFTSDGTIYLYNGDISHYSDNYWPTVDSYRLPGTTELTTKLDESPDRKNNDPKSYEVLLKSKFSGATKLDERFATAAMQFNNFNDKLKIKKAWFVMDDKVVFLGSDLQNNSSDEAITTVENRKVKSGESYNLIANGKNVESLKNQKINKLLLENSEKNRNIGYIFLNGETINAFKAQRTGKWSDLRKDSANTEFTNNFVTVTTNHNDSNKDYAYVMYPNISKSEFDKVSENNIKVLQNDSKIQAVKDVKNNVWGLVIYDDNTKFKIDDNLSLKGKGVYTVRLLNDKYTISAFNPETKEFNENSIISNLSKTYIQKLSPVDYSTILELKLNKKSSNSDKNISNGNNGSVGNNDNKSANIIKNNQNINNSNNANPETGDDGKLNILVIGISGMIALFVINKKKNLIK